MSEPRYKEAKQLVDDFKAIGIAVTYDHVRNLMRIAPCTIGGRSARFDELLAFWKTLPAGTNVRKLARQRQVEIGRIRTL